MSSERILPIELSDAWEVFALLERHYDQPLSPMGGSWSLQSIETELRTGGGLGLYVDGRLRAFILYRESELEVEISVLATDRDEIRKGYMNRLLTNFLERARGHGREVWLEVHEYNVGAQKMYEKLGFKRVGQRPLYYRDKATAWLYTWR